MEFAVQPGSAAMASQKIPVGTNNPVRFCLCFFEEFDSKTSEARFIKSLKIGSTRLRRGMEKCITTTYIGT